MPPMSDAEYRDFVTESKSIKGRAALRNPRVNARRCAGAEKYGLTITTTGQR